MEREKKKVARLTKSIAASRLRDEEASRKRKEQEEGEEEHVGEDTSKERGQRVTAPKPKLTPAEVIQGNCTYTPPTLSLQLSPFCIMRH